jgi:hypothetical protein
VGEDEAEKAGEERGKEAEMLYPGPSPLSLFPLSLLCLFSPFSVEAVSSGV